MEHTQLFLANVQYQYPAQRLSLSGGGILEVAYSN
jgi:hypothetical protein